MFYDNLKTHRQKAGLKIAALARAAGVGESTIRRIEKHEASTVETLNAIINALNATSYFSAKPILATRAVKSKSKYGASVPKVK